jgi:hypothetical protein
MSSDTLIIVVLTVFLLGIGYGKATANYQEVYAHALADLYPPQ